MHCFLTGFVFSGLVLVLVLDRDGLSVWQRRVDVGRRADWLIGPAVPMIGGLCSDVTTQNKAGPAPCPPSNAQKAPELRCM